MGSKVTKEVGGQTSCGCVCYCAGSDSGGDEESVIGSCGEENECVDDAVSASDATGLTIECQRFSMIIYVLFPQDNVFFSYSTRMGLMDCTLTSGADPCSTLGGIIPHFYRFFRDFEILGGIFRFCRFFKF